MTAKEHNRTLGILFLVYFGLQLFGIIIGILVGFLFAGVAISEMNHSDTAPLVIIAVGVVIAIAISALLLFPIGMAGWKMFKEKPNSKIWAIIASVIAVLNFPLGTVLGVYGLWFVLGDQGKQFYEGKDPIGSFQRPVPPNSWQ
jgi:hypothetical protein